MAEGRAARAAGGRVAPGGRPEPEAAGLDYRRLKSSFDRALHGRSDLARTSFHRVAGRTLRLRTVGGEPIHRLRRPFLHLSVDPSDLSEPRLTVDLWDAAQTGIRCDVPPPCADIDAPASIAAAGDGRWVARRSETVCTARDRRRASLVGCIRDGTRLTPHDRFTPLQWDLGLWLADHGVQLLHASLVAHRGRGALLVGPGDVGKTTVLLLCLADGIQCVADDRVGLEESGRYGFVGHGLYSSSAVPPRHLRRFSWLRRPSHPSELDATEGSGAAGKTFVDLADIRPGQFVPSAPVRVLLLPRRVPGRGCVVSPATPGEALGRLMPTSLRLVPPAALGPALERLGRLARRVPARWLDAGPDLRGVAGGVREAVEEMSSGDA